MKQLTWDEVLPGVPDHKPCPSSWVSRVTHTHIQFGQALSWGVVSTLYKWFSFLKISPILTSSPPHLKPSSKQTFLSLTSVANIWRAACGQNIFEKHPVNQNIFEKAAYDQKYLKSSLRPKKFEKQPVIKIYLKSSLRQKIFERAAWRPKNIWRVVCDQNIPLKREICIAHTFPG